MRLPAPQGQSFRGKCVCEEPAWQDQHFDTAVQTQALTCLEVLHDAIRVFDKTMASMQISRSSVTEEKTAEAARVRRRRIKIQEAVLTAKVAKPLAKWNRRRFGPGAEFRHTAMGFTQQISHPLSRSSLQTRRRLFNDVSPRTKRKSNAK